MKIKITQDHIDKWFAIMLAISNKFPRLRDDMLEITRQSKIGIQLEITHIKSSKTDDQVGYYRSQCREFAKWAGNTPDEMHEYLLSMTFGTELAKTAIGTWRRPVKRSADLSVGDYAELIETLIRVASECGYVVPPPRIKEDV